MLKGHSFCLLLLAAVTGLTDRNHHTKEIVPIMSFIEEYSSIQLKMKMHTLVPQVNWLQGKEDKGVFNSELSLITNDHSEESFFTYIWSFANEVMQGEEHRLVFSPKDGNELREGLSVARPGSLFKLSSSTYQCSPLDVWCPITIQGEGNSSLSFASKGFNIHSSIVIKEVNLFLCGNSDKQRLFTVDSSQAHIEVKDCVLSAQNATGDNCCFYSGESVSVTVSSCIVAGFGRVLDIGKNSCFSMDACEVQDNRIAISLVSPEKVSLVRNCIQCNRGIGVDIQIQKKVPDKQSDSEESYEEIQDVIMCIEENNFIDNGKGGVAIWSEHQDVYEGTVCILSNRINRCKGEGIFIKNLIFHALEITKNTVEGNFRTGL